MFLDQIVINCLRKKCTWIIIGFFPQFSRFFLQFLNICRSLPKMFFPVLSAPFKISIFSDSKSIYLFIYSVVSSPPPFFFFLINYLLRQYTYFFTIVAHSTERVNVVTSFSVSSLKKYKLLIKKRKTTESFINDLFSIIKNLASHYILTVIKWKRIRFLRVRYWLWFI